MSTKTTDYENLRHYLLGRMTEEEEQPLLARLLADPELFELAEATEAEILDECFRGELAREDCQGLLDRLGVSPAGRRRIALAQALAAAVDSSAAASRPEPAAVLPFRRPGLLARPAVRAAALAAALVGAAVVVWQVQPGSSPAPSTRTAARPATPAKPASEEIASKPTTPAAPATAPPLVFELSLITFRGGGDSVPELKIPLAKAAGKAAEKAEIELGLHLSERETSSAYDVSLKRGGEDVWGPRRLAAPKSPEPRLAVRLPASALAAGTYEVEVRGVAPDGSTELVGTQDFRVVR